LAKTLEPLPALREGALQSLRLRFVYDLANGAGLGLLGVSSVLVAGNWRLLDQRSLLWLLLAVPLAHTLLMAGFQLLLHRACARHYRRLFVDSELLLIILSSEWIGRPHFREDNADSTRLEFKQRLESASRHWRELIALAGGRAIPQRWWIVGWPVMLGLAWATLTEMAARNFGFYALTAGVVFAIVALDATGCRWAIARNQFLLALAEVLERDATPALHSKS
jgi:hypothetical protein